MRWITTLRRSVSSRRRETSSSLPIVSSARVITGLVTLQLGGEPAHRVRRRLQIDREQDRQLARRKIRLAVGDEREGEIAAAVSAPATAAARRPWARLGPRSFRSRNSFPRHRSRGKRERINRRSRSFKQRIERARGLALAAFRAAGLAVGVQA